MENGKVGKRGQLLFVHLIDTIGSNNVISKNLLQKLIITNEIYYITSKLSAVDGHVILTPSSKFLKMIKCFTERNLLNAFSQIYYELNRLEQFYIKTPNVNYKKVIDRIIRRAFCEKGRKLQIPISFKNGKIKNFSDLITKLETFIEQNLDILSKYNYEIVNYGANTDLKIKQLNPVSLKYLINLHIHYGFLVEISPDYFTKKGKKEIFILRQIITFLFLLIYILSIVKFNFYIHNNKLKKRKNIYKFRDFIKYFVNIDTEGFVYPVLLATTYTVDDEVNYTFKNNKVCLMFRTPINKRINWNYLLPYDITGSIDVITSDKKLKELLKQNGFRRSRTYINRNVDKAKKIVGCYRKNVRKKIIVFNRKKLERLVNYNKITPKNTYVKWKSRKAILNIVKNSHSIDKAVEEFNSLIRYYIKYNNIYGITIIAKIVKMYNYFVINENINNWEIIKRKILRYLKPKPKSKRKAQKSIHERSSSLS